MTFQEVLGVYLISVTSGVLECNQRDIFSLERKAFDLFHEHQLENGKWISSSSSKPLPKPSLMLTQEEWEQTQLGGADSSYINSTDFQGLLFLAEDLGGILLLRFFCLPRLLCFQKIEKNFPRVLEWLAMLPQMTRAQQYQNGVIHSFVCQFLVAAITN